MKKVRTQTKRILSVLQILIMLLLSVQVAIGADIESGFCGREGDGHNLTWTLNRETGVLSINGDGMMADFSYGYVPDFFYKKNAIKTIIIGNDVTSIGNWAFGDFDELQTISIGKNVNSIGRYAFRNCKKLAAVTIPNNVNSIGENAFFNCTGLKVLQFENGISSIESSAFAGCSGLTAVSIPNSVTDIGYAAFSNCTELSSISLSENLNRIGSDVFSNTLFSNTNSNWEKGGLYLNHYLVEVDSSAKGHFGIRPGTKAICDEAFMGCIGLTSVTIPDGIKSISDSAFMFCSLASVTIPDSVISIGQAAFMMSGLESVVIPKSVTYIGPIAFQLCTKLTAFTVNSNNPNFCSDEFGCLYNKDKSTLFYYPIGNTRASFSIPTSVQRIGNQSFSSCDYLKTITISNSVVSIGDAAFSLCPLLESVYIPKNVTSIGDIAFSNCASLTALSVDPNNVMFSSDEAGCLYNKEKTIILQYPIGNSRTEFSIPSSITMIGDSAFSGCTKLTKINIPDSVKSFGKSVFYGCKGLTSIAIPNQLTTITSSAFYGCTNLTTVIIPVSITSIGSHGFYGCDSLRDIYYFGSSSDWRSKVFVDYSICEYDNLRNAIYHFSYVPGDHVHSYTATTITSATCTRKGEKKLTCSCNESYIIKTAIDPNNHALDENGNCTLCGKHIDVTQQTADNEFTSNNDSEQSLSFFQRIIQWFRNVFSKLFSWLK